MLYSSTSSILIQVVPAFSNSSPPRNSFSLEKQANLQQQDRDNRVDDQNSSSELIQKLLSCSSSVRVDNAMKKHDFSRKLSSALVLGDSPSFS
ncbi:hypothetical protein TNCV_3176401 [Trichonephila clavipes]|nr:hypothetical protein TNCV_3176401 [Trichonephila clavipes]